MTRFALFSSLINHRDKVRAVGGRLCSYYNRMALPATESNPKSHEVEVLL